MKLLPEKDYHELFRIGILVKADPGTIPGIREIFTRHHALEITESP